MVRILLLSALVLLLGGVNGLITVGYLPSYRVHAVDIDFITSKLDYIIYFSIYGDKNGYVVNDHDVYPDGDDKINQHLKLLSETCKKKGCKLLLALGGAGRSAFFQRVLGDRDLAKRFGDQVYARYIHNGIFDGFDINWQFPSPKKEPYTFYLKFIKRLKAIGANQRKKVIISVPYKPIIEYLGPQAKYLNSAHIFSSVDFFTAMAYDLKDVDKHHSAYKTAVGVIEEIRSLNPMIMGKMVLGIPFYGNEVDSKDSSKSYEELIHQGKRNGNVDEMVVNNNLIYKFNQPETVARKVELAIDNYLLGVAVWELGQDCRKHKVDRFNEKHEITCTNNYRPLLETIDDVRQRRREHEDL
jgi:GH18 family chitinase